MCFFMTFRPDGVLIRLGASKTKPNTGESKPDIGKSEPTQVYWNQVLIPFEFKHKKNAKDPSHKNLDQPPPRTAIVPSPEKLANDREPSVDIAESVAGGYGSESGENGSDDDEDSDSGSDASSDNSDSESDAEASGDETETEDTYAKGSSRHPTPSTSATLFDSAFPSSPRTSDPNATSEEDKKPKLTDLEQLGSYALEVLSANGVRRFTYGIHIVDTEVRLWYFDRSGEFGSRPLDLQCLDDVHLFVRLFFAIGSTKRSETFGFEPYLPSKVTRFPQHPEQCTLRVPHKSMGGVESIAGCDKLYRITKDVLNNSTRRGLKGRGTLVLTARDSTTGESVVIKLSWQLPGQGDVKRESEANMLAEVVNHPHLPTLVANADLTDLSVGVRDGLTKLYPDHRVPSDHHEVDHRILRVVVMKELCVPLSSVRNIKKFNKAFRSLVRGS